jgi:hypothetical protein
MDIRLPLESGVSVNKHCVVLYEPKDRVFYIQKGDYGDTLLNGDEVPVIRPISAKDKITIGGAEFLLIPLCSDEFNWERYIT